MASESKTDDPGGAGPPGVLPCIFATSLKSSLCGIAKNLIYSLLTDAFLFAVCVKISRATLIPTYACGSGMRELDLGRRRRAPRLPDCFSSNLVFLRIGPVKARRSPKAHATQRRCGVECLKRPAGAPRTPRVQVRFCTSASRMWSTLRPRPSLTLSSPSSRLFLSAPLSFISSLLSLMDHLFYLLVSLISIVCYITL